MSIGRNYVNDVIVIVIFAISSNYANIWDNDTIIIAWSWIRWQTAYFVGATFVSSVKFLFLTKIKSCFSYLFSFYCPLWAISVNIPMCSLSTWPLISAPPLYFDMLNSSLELSCWDLLVFSTSNTLFILPCTSTNLRTIMFCKRENKTSSVHLMKSRSR